MCGINGFVTISPNSDINEHSIQKMNQAIMHRGPDSNGITQKDNVVFGHLRLAILDLSPLGHQPMKYTHNGRTIQITFNGEIYNYAEIKKTLAAKGYSFVSTSDTEVILAAYIEYGTDCVQLFNGMFAFVIYDEDNKQLFGARDRFGQKPFKYVKTENEFIFSSELKAILTHPSVSREINRSAIYHYLTLQYIPGTHTGFSNIKKLLPGHFFTLDCETLDMHIEKYYVLPTATNTSRTTEQWMTDIDTTINAAVQRRLISDVPVGAFLSGGVDSSAIVSYMSEHTDNVNTFSISFTGDSYYDESAYARKVAELYGTNHNEFVVSPRDLLEYIENLPVDYEEPFADVSALPTSILCKKTREHVTVALSGDAGDENFGGYERHIIQKKYQVLRPLLTALRATNMHKRIQNDHIRKLIHYSTSPVWKRHYNFTGFFDEYTLMQQANGFLAQNNYSPSEIFADIINDNSTTTSMDDLSKIYYLDIHSYLPDDINVKVDIASMQYALEVRAPFLDHTVVELAASIPHTYKTSPFQGKKILKKTLEKRLPSEILYRKKHGFSVPISEWLSADLAPLLRNTLLDSNGIILQIFETNYISSLIDEHIARRQDNGKKLWSLLQLGIWYNSYS